MEGEALKQALEHDAAQKAVNGAAHQDEVPSKDPAAAQAPQQPVVTRGEYTPPGPEMFHQLELKQALLAKSLSLDMLQTTRAFVSLANTPVEKGNPKHDPKTGQVTGGRFLPPDPDTSAKCLAIAEHALRLAEKLDVLADKAMARFPTPAVEKPAVSTDAPTA